MRVAEVAQHTTVGAAVGGESGPGTPAGGRPAMGASRP